MIKEINNRKGQTALILILLAGAALILLSITLNWGRIAQTKTMLTVAANQGGSILASDAASYGEMQKQTYLLDVNRKSSIDWQIILAIIMIVVAIVVTIFSWGTGSAIWVVVANLLLVASIVMSVVNLVLLLAVIEPGETALWAKIQADQPAQQQFYEQGISTALSGSVTDPANITDYFDLNTNGRFGNTNNLSNDVIGRFSFFYTDRLKMINKGDIPQVSFFYNQLAEFMNGETCAQNFIDNSVDPGIPINQNCIDPLTKANYCGPDPSNPSPDPACTGPIPNGFQLSDSCVDSDPGNSPNYNPYCDPCCQIPLIQDGAYSAASPNPLHPNPWKAAVPSSCPQLSVPKCSPTNADGTPNLNADPNDPSCLQALQSAGECLTNNPYNSYGSYPYLYDPSFQEYPFGVSFLDQFGRDQQIVPPTVPPAPPVPPLTNMTAVQMESSAGTQYFPNGIYPFFWLMKDYSPEVDNINPIITPLTAAQVHWCVAPALNNGVPNGIPNPPVGYIPTDPITSAAFPGLVQLSLDYACQGQDCCVNSIADSIVNGLPMLSATPANGVIDMVGSMDPSLQPAPSPSPVASTVFGESASSATATWLEGDNQMCTATWPYNGKPSALPDGDGSCQWTNTDKPPASKAAGGSPPVLSSSSTVDSLDDTMHTLSDFVVYANNFLSQDPEKLNTTFNTWYPQAAQWIAPKCANGDNGTDTLTGLPCNLDTDANSSVDTSDPNCTLTDNTCNTDSAGRLLSIYEPQGYPGIPSVSAGTPVDELAKWNDVLTPWMSNTYTPPAATSATVWCVPMETALLNGNATTAEDAYINTNSAVMAQSSVSTTTTWGDLPHVISCLKYNSDNTQTQTSVTPNNYQTCLNALPLGACPATLPAVCSAQALGYSSLIIPPTFTGAPGVGGDCDLNNIKSFAYWVNSQTNFGSVYSYQTCLNLLTNACPASVTGTVCDPSVLGRSLLNPTIEPNPGFNGASSCDPNPGNYAQWVSDNLALARAEAPKFELRYAFLNDVYTRAQTMQNIFTEGDTALHNFLKTCTGCADGSSCPGSGICTADNSACGSPKGKCEDGGPAAQLIWARAQGDQTRKLPNALIYGWIDNVPTGSGGCTSNGQKVGCAHIVKVTAYSPGRGGNAAFVNDALPEIHKQTIWTVWCDPAVGCPEFGVLPVPIPWLVYTLIKRDGYVYVSIKRWDQDHSNPITFPNGHSLWQSMFHNPTVNLTTSGQGFPSSCHGLNPTGTLSPGIGWGLLPQTVKGLEFNNQLSTTDQTSLTNAFMLNDEGDGKIDPSVGDGTSPICSAGSSSPYCQCLGWSNLMLSAGTESHVCAEYIASRDASHPSTASETPSTFSFAILLPRDPPKNPDEADYSLKFVDCSTVPGYKPGTPPDDLTYTASDSATN